MDQINFAITLLTIVVTMLSVIIAVLLAVIIVVLVKLNHIASQAKVITDNLSSATAWLSPMTVFSAAARAFRKR